MIVVVSWSGAWLFVAGICHLDVWRTLLALFLWPYYLGDWLTSH
jgi:hypothetical protein